MFTQKNQLDCFYSVWEYLCQVILDHHTVCSQTISIKLNTNKLYELVILAGNLTEGQKHA